MKEKYNRLLNHIKSNKKVFTIYFILRVFVIGTMIAQFFNQNYENVFLCLLTLILFMVPSFIEVNFRIDFPDALEIIILLFIFSAEILGEIRSYYITYPFWDTMLHTVNGFLAAAVGFCLVDLLNRNERFMLKLSPLFTAIVAFCFSMTIGVMWEFFEYGMDTFFGYDMQKDTIIYAINSVTFDPTMQNIVHRISDIESVVINGKDLGLGGYLDIGLIDTMKDMFVNFIGAVIFSIIGYFYVKYKGKGRSKVASNFIPIIENWDDNKIVENKIADSE